MLSGVREPVYEFYYYLIGGQSEDATSSSGEEQPGCLHFRQHASFKPEDHHVTSSAMRTINHSVPWWNPSIKFRRTPLHLVSSMAKLKDSIFTIHWRNARGAFLDLCDQISSELTTVLNIGEQHQGTGTAI